MSQNQGWPTWVRWAIDVKKVDLKNKNVKWKNIVDKLSLTKLFKRNETNYLPVKLLSYNVHDSIWELWLFIREFPIAAILNPSLKSRFV